MFFDKIFLILVVRRAFVFSFSCLMFSFRLRRPKVFARIFTNTFECVYYSVVAFRAIVATAEGRTDTSSLLFLRELNRVKCRSVGFLSEVERAQWCLAYVILKPNMRLC